MRKIMFFVCLAFSANFSFAGKSDILPLPNELQEKELPLFGIIKLKSEGKDYSFVEKEEFKAIVAKNKSKMVVLSFYSTSCIPCRIGLKKMKDGAAMLEKNNILVVLVNTADTANSETLSKFEKQYAQKEWLLGLDEHCNMAEAFGLTKQGCDKIVFPRTLLLDSNLRPLKLIGAEGDDFLQIMEKAK